MKDWRSIWLTFAGYALILGIVFPLVFKHWPVVADCRPGALLLGVNAFALAFAGWMNVWAAAAFAVVLFALGIFAVPMAVMLIWRRRTG